MQAVPIASLTASPKATSFTLPQSTKTKTMQSELLRRLHPRVCVLPTLPLLPQHPPQVRFRHPLLSSFRHTHRRSVRQDMSCGARDEEEGNAERDEREPVEDRAGERRLGGRVFCVVQGFSEREGRGRGRGLRREPRAARSSTRVAGSREEVSNVAERVAVKICVVVRGV